MERTKLPTLRLTLFDGDAGPGGAPPAPPAGQSPAPADAGAPTPAGRGVPPPPPGPGEGRPPQTPDPPAPPADRQGRFMDRTLGRWSAQAAQAARSYPGLDLRAEARDPRFLRMLSAGVPVKTAYEALHHHQLLRAAARDAAQAAEKSVVDGVRARGARPRENGTAAQSAFVVKEDVSRLSPREMEDISRRVMRGEKISFG